MTDKTLAPVTNQEERVALLKFSVSDLRTIAEKIGAPTARSKEELATNIMTRAEEQGIAFSGYVQAVSANATLDGETEDELAIEGQNGNPQPQPLVDVPLFDAYSTRVKHFMFTVGAVAEPDLFSGLYDVASVDEVIARHYKAGYVPREVFVGGFDPRGHRVGWLLEKVADGEDAQYSESHVVMQTLVTNPDPAYGTVSGFQADAYIGNFLDDGWDLFGMRFNGIDINSGGVFLVWFLAR